MVLTEIYRPTTAEDLEELFRKTIARNLEGLMVKDVKGVYKPNLRHWIKLKKVGKPQSVTYFLNNVGKLSRNGRYSRLDRFGRLLGNWKQRRTPIGISHGSLR